MLLTCGNVFAMFGIMCGKGSGGSFVMDQELGCSTLVNYGDVRAPKLDVDEKVSHYASSDGD